MARDPKSHMTENRRFSRRGFLEKVLAGIMLASAAALPAFASMADVQAGGDEFSSQGKSKVTKSKSRKKAGGAAKPESSPAKPSAGSPQPAGGIGRPETPGY
jgi:hypothetical protein